jgi:hypothetical protein
MTEALKALEKFLGYPFPIAFVLKTEVLEGKTPKEQVDGLIRLAETALQYATLIAVSDYACAEFKDERVSHRLERLRRPLTSDFANFLRDAVPILKEHGALFVPELAEAINEATRKQVQAVRMGEWGLEEREMPLLDALVNLRNAVRHGRWVGRFEAFIEHHVPLVADFLHLMAWCERYPLLRLLRGGQCLRLMGAETTFAPEPIPDAALEELARAQRAGELTGLLLADPSLSRFRTLYPAYDVWQSATPELKEAIFRQWEENRQATGGNSFDLPEWASAYPEVTPANPAILQSPSIIQHSSHCPFPPFKWDEERRARLRAELDAYYARLYGLTRKQLRYILDPADLTEKELADILDPWEEVDDPLEPTGYEERCRKSTFPGETFRVLKEKEIRQFGEYRTRRLILEAWERLKNEVV